MDNISDELLQYGDMQLIGKLTKLFNNTWDTYTIQADLHHNTYIQKRTKDQNWKLQRYNITLFICTLKQSWKNTSLIDEEQGFRKNRPSTDALFIITQIKEKSIEFSNSAYACFVDLTNVFEKSDWLISILNEECDPTTIVKAIYNLNVGNTIKIKVDNQTTREIHTLGQ